jgi:hypothetical protein
MHTGFWWGNLRERHHLENTDVDGRKYKDGSSGNGVGVIYWIDLAQGRER